MNILLIEDKVYNTGSIVEKMMNGYPTTSTIIVNKGSRKIQESLYKLKTPPIFTDNYLVIIQPGVKLEDVEKFMSEKNLVIVYTPNSKKNEYLVELKQYGAKVLDNFNLSKSKLIDYVKDNLVINESNANKVCKKCGYYLPYVWEAVSVLKNLEGEVVEEHIKLYVDNKHNIMPRDIYNYIIGYRNLNRTAIIKYLYDFRYAFKYLKKSTIGYGDAVLEIYNLMITGELTGENYLEYSFPKKIDLTDYQKKIIILEIFPTISIDVIIKTNVYLKGLRRINDLIKII